MHWNAGALFADITMALGTPIEQLAGLGAVKFISLMSQRTWPPPIRQEMLPVGDCHWDHAWVPPVAPPVRVTVAVTVERRAVVVTTGASDDAVTTTVTVDDGGKVTVGGAVGPIDDRLVDEAAGEPLVATGCDDVLPDSGFESVTIGDGPVGSEPTVAGTPVVARAAVVTCAACPSTSAEHPASSRAPITRSEAPDQRRPRRVVARARISRDADRSVSMIPRP